MVVVGASVVGFTKNKDRYATNEYCSEMHMVYCMAVVKSILNSIA